MSQQKDYGNTIIIGSDKPADADKYIFALIKSLQPLNYENYCEEGIKIQVTEKNLPLAEYVLGFFKNLWVEEIGRELKMGVRKERPDGSTYLIDVIEITLKKHPKLRR